MVMNRILIVEDDDYLREALCDTLSLTGHNTTGVADGYQALRELKSDNYALVVSDVHMEPMDGHSLLKSVKQQFPKVPVVMMTAYGTIEKAVDAMRLGADDYLVKPFEADALGKLIKRLLPESSQALGADDGLIACDGKMEALKSLAARVAQSEATVLLNGESGVGKEVFAGYIHQQSSRADGPFVAINCAAIPENMLESVLFGYEKGAFTGAHHSHPGKFEQAQNGTLLLDEISEMDLSLQAKLLRVLQEKEVERLGGRKTIALNVRVLATTNRNLREEVAAGRFREDLFYRLNVFPLRIPPLRERVADIVPISRALIKKHCAGKGSTPQLTPEAEQKLVSHTWPGNVRELDNVIQRALILMSDELIRAEDIQCESACVDCIPPSAMAYVDDEQDSILVSDLKDREQQLILEALRAGKGSRKYAAERLGISPRTLRYKLARMREAGISVPG